MRCAAIGFALLLSAVSPSFAANSGVPSAIVSLATEKCLTVDGNSTAQNAAVNQLRCDSRQSEQWTAKTVAGIAGFVYFMNERSGMCLDDPFGGATPGKLQQFPCHQGDTQLFRFEPIEDEFGGMRIISKLTGRCLDVPGGASSDGLRIQEFDCHTGLNQRWLHASPGAAHAAVYATIIPQIQLSLAGGRTYTMRMSGFSAGAVPCLHLWRDDGSGDVAFQNTSTGGTVQISYTVPPNVRYAYTLFVFNCQGRGVGRGTLTVSSGGSVIRTVHNLRFGGRPVVVPGSPDRLAYQYQTALLPGGAEDTFLILMTPNGVMVAFDDDSGAGAASLIGGRAFVSKAIVGGARGKEGLTGLYANDVLHDADGEGEER